MWIFCVAGGRLACGVRVCICICMHTCLCVVHECLQVTKKEHVACYDVVHGCLPKC
jgi:hypothetical protein